MGVASANNSDGHDGEEENEEGVGMLDWNDQDVEAQVCNNDSVSLAENGSTPANEDDESSQGHGSSVVVVPSSNPAPTHMSPRKER